MLFKLSSSEAEKSFSNHFHCNPFPVLFFLKYSNLQYCNYRPNWRRAKKPLMGRKAGKSALLGAAVAGLISLISEYVSGKEEDAGPQRRKKDEDEEEKETMTEFICNATKDMIAENIPVEAIRDVRPKSYMYAFGLLSLLAMIICFLYYMYTVYQRSINQKFISLSSSSGDCVVVTKSVTGTFLGDSYGNWIGEDGFSYSQAKYELILTRAEWSKEDYAGIMLVALDQIRDLANAGQTMDFAANLAALTSWQLTCNATKYAVCEKFAGQSFVFTASAQVRVLLAQLIKLIF